MKQRPNIVIITTHDTGRHFGCYGVPSVTTPAIDALADDGVRLTNFFATCSICTPSRSSMMTGQYPATNGLQHLAGTNGHAELDHYDHHLARILQQQGYHTGLFGHQHETADARHLRFDTAPSFPAKFSAVDVAQGFAEFVRGWSSPSQPFYAQVGFFETHTPYDYTGAAPAKEQGLWLPPWTDASLDDPAMCTHVAGLQGSVNMVDRAVEQITTVLRERDLEENTLLVFTVDHGLELPLGKWTMYDGGTEIAFIVRWPGGGIEGGRSCDWLLSNVDVLPTLAAMVGLPLAARVEGVSFEPALRGDVSEMPSPRDAVYSEFYGSQNFAVRTATHKFIRNFWGSHFHPPDSETEHRNPTVELFDLQADPHERDNLAYDPAHRATRDTMSNLLWRWLIETNNPILAGPARDKGASPGAPNDRWQLAMADFPG